MPQTDLIEDFTARMLEAAAANDGKLDAKTALQVAEAIRSEYKRDRVYIGVTPAETIRDLGARNRQLYGDYQKGVHVAALMRKYKIGHRDTVYKIIRQFKPRNV
jgi:Mor family transcriptional regulator